MVSAELSADEIARIGEQWYAEQLRTLVEPAHRGKYLVLDIRSGDYQIAPDDLTATRELLSRHPDALTYGVRIGYPEAYRLGAIDLRAAQ